MRATSCTKSALCREMSPTFVENSASVASSDLTTCTSPLQRATCSARLPSRIAVSSLISCSASTRNFSARTMSLFTLPFSTFFGSNSPATRIRFSAGSAT